MTSIQQLKIPAEEIFKLNGIISVTVGRLGQDPSTFYHCMVEGDESPRRHARRELQQASIKMLDSNDLEMISVVIDGYRILVARWSELACAVMTATGSEVNKSIRRKIRLVGQKYDRKTPELVQPISDPGHSATEVAKPTDDRQQVADLFRIDR